MGLVTQRADTATLQVRVPASLKRSVMALKTRAAKAHCDVAVTSALVKALERAVMVANKELDELTGPRPGTLPVGSEISYEVRSE